MYVWCEYGKCLWLLRRTDGGGACDVVNVERVLDFPHGGEGDECVCVDVDCTRG